MQDDIRRRLRDQHRRNLNGARAVGRDTFGEPTSEHVYEDPHTGEHVPASEAPKEAFIDRWKLVGPRIVERRRPVADYDCGIRSGARRSRVQALRVTMQAPATSLAAPRERREKARSSSRSGDPGDDDSAPDPPAWDPGPPPPRIPGQIPLFMGWR